MYIVRMFVCMYIYMNKHTYIHIITHIPINRPPSQANQKSATDILDSPKIKGQQNNRHHKYEYKVVCEPTAKNVHK